MAGLAGLCWTLAAEAAPPDFPLPATPTTEHSQTVGSYRLPTGPFADGAVPVRRLEGQVLRRVWHLDAPGRSTLDLLDPLRAKIEQAGYAIVFQCETNGCGGFDFRFNAGVLPEPEMHVDLGDFRFLSATSPTDGALSLMVSRSATTGYVQLTELLPPGPEQQTSAAAPPDGFKAAPGAAAATERLRIPVPPDPAQGDPASGGPAPGVPVPGAPVPAGPSADAIGTNAGVSDAPGDGGPSALGAVLLARGSVTLEGLEFASGSSDLTEGSYASLEALAGWMKENPERTVILVGHTDTSGALDGNIALSRQRAQSVRDRLIRNWGIGAQQLDAQGVGYLAPRDSNQTDTGRTRNRRVEAVLTSAG